MTFSKEKQVVRSVVTLREWCTSWVSVHYWVWSQTTAYIRSLILFSWALYRWLIYIIISHKLSVFHFIVLIQSFSFHYLPIVFCFFILYYHSIIRSSLSPYSFLFLKYLFTLLMPRQPPLTQIHCDWKHPPQHNIKGPLWYKGLHNFLLFVTSRN